MNEGNELKRKILNNEVNISDVYSDYCNRKIRLEEKIKKLQGEIDIAKIDLEYCDITIQTCEGIIFPDINPHQ